MWKWDIRKLLLEDIAEICWQEETMEHVIKCVQKRKTNQKKTEQILEERGDSF